MKLSEDTRETLAMIEEAATSLFPPAARRTRPAQDVSADHDADAWEKMGAQGWLDILRLEDPSGDGVGIRAAVMLAERLGYAGRHPPFVEVAMMSMRCLMGCPNKVLAEALMRTIGGAGRMVGLAWQSPDGALDASASRITADPQGEGVTLRGSARFVAAHGAETFIVGARAASEPLLCAVPRRDLAIRHEKMADESGSGLVGFESVVVPPASILGRGAQAGQALDRAIELGVLGTAAELLGNIDRSLALTLEYLGTRRQFGKTIGSFQVLQHRAVDMWIQKELTRAALRAAVSVFCDGSASIAEIRAAASSAKARASQAALYVTGQAIQLHGAIGFTDEYALGAYSNRSLRLAAQLGNASTHRRRYGHIVKIQER